MIWPYLIAGAAGALPGVVLQVRHHYEVRSYEATIRSLAEQLGREADMRRQNFDLFIAEKGAVELTLAEARHDAEVALRDLRRVRPLSGEDRAARDRAEARLRELVG